VGNYHGPWTGNTNGYAAFATETTPGTAVQPTVFTQLTDETMTTSYNLEEQDVIFGNPAATFQVLPGQRTHKGDITIVAEPNTAAQIADCLLTRGTLSAAYTFTVTSANATIGATYTNNSVTFTVVATIVGATTLLMTSTGAPLTSGTLTKSSGTGDATITFSAAVNTTDTWPFTLSNSTNPNTKTVEISLGASVKRFVGVQCSKLVLSQSKNQLMLKPSFSALGSFQTGVIASVSGSGPYTIVFDTTYDTNPTRCLIATDLIRGYHAGSAYIDGTIATVVDAKTITTTTNMSSLVAGDTISLRPQTPSFNFLTPFLWSNTQFCPGATAAAALSATQLQVEQGSNWELDYNFESDDGSLRSGSADPAALIRTVGNAMLNVKKYFDTPDDIVYFNQQSKRSWVIRHFAGGSNQYELRVTFNHVKTDDPMPKIKSKAVNYSDIKFKSQYDQTDSAMYSLLVINLTPTMA